MIAFVDMDGIVVDMVGHLIKRLGYQPEIIYNNWPKGSYYIYDAINLTEKETHDIMDEGFWLTATLTEEAEELMEIITNKFNQVAFLTMPVRRRGCIDGKHAWRDRYFPEIPIITTEVKYYLAAPDKLLIDDYDQNISQFVEYGGKGILLPRHWNSQHERKSEAITVLREALSKY